MVPERRIHVLLELLYATCFQLIKALRPESLQIIPIFPLRKRILLPTEQIVLNLYEERYLLLADQFLDEDSSRLIGAVPSTSKLQIIARGSGPIVPLLEPGDVGVLCKVNKAEEAQIPTVGGSLRRRIRLECQATSRLELTRIISRGTASPFDITGGDGLFGQEGGMLPYITAEYRLLTRGKNKLPKDNIGGEDNGDAISEEFLAFEEYLERKGGTLNRLDRLRLLQSGMSFTSKG